MALKKKELEIITDTDTPEEVIEKVLGITETPEEPKTSSEPEKPIVRRGPDLSKEAHRGRLGVK